MRSVTTRQLITRLPWLDLFIIIRSGGVLWARAIMMEADCCRSIEVEDRRGRRGWLGSHKGRLYTFPVREALVLMVVFGDYAFSWVLWACYIIGLLSWARV